MALQDKESPLTTKRLLIAALGIGLLAGGLGCTQSIDEPAESGNTSESLTTRPDSSGSGSGGPPTTTRSSSRTEGAPNQAAAQGTLGDLRALRKTLEAKKDAGQSLSAEEVDAILRTVEGAERMVEDLERRIDRLEKK